jgi:hypothetical protein
MKTLSLAALAAAPLAIAGALLAGAPVPAAACAAVQPLRPVPLRVVASTAERPATAMVVSVAVESQHASLDGYREPGLEAWKLPPPVVVAGLGGMTAASCF